MPTLELKPTHKAVTAYYDSLAKFAQLGIKYETAVRSAFHELLEHCARQFDWKLVPEYAFKRKGHADAKADGALLDNYGLNHGLWEGKDSADDLDKEIKHKFAVGYPKQNILFWQPDRAVLYQNSERFYEGELTEAAIQSVIYHGKPYRLTEDLEKLRSQLQQNPEGLVATALRVKQKEQALAYLNKELAFISWEKSDCEEREKREDEAHQAAAGLPSPEVLEKIMRYQTMLDRQRYRAMAQLERLQRMRQGETIPPPLTMEVSERL